MDTFIDCNKCGKQTFYTKKNCDYCGEELVKSKQVLNFIKKQEEEKQKKEKIRLQIEEKEQEKLEKLKNESLKLQEVNRFIICQKCGKETFNTKSRCDFCGAELDKSKEVQNKFKEKNENFNIEIKISDDNEVIIKNNNLDVQDINLSIADELIKLNELKKEGILTEDEFSNQKTRLLNNSTLSSKIKKTDNHIKDTLYSTVQNSTIVDKSQVSTNLQKCKDCGGLVSTNAKICPYCGANDPTTTIGDKVGGFVLVAIIVLVISFFWGNSDDAKEEPSIKQTHIDYSVYDYSDLDRIVSNADFNPGIYCSNKTSTENELLECLATVMDAMKDKGMMGN